MGLATEFKKFAMRGNVVDLAVGVMVGAAFGKIVSSLVDNVISPPLGLLLAGVNFSEHAAQIGVDAAGKPVLLKYGLFIQSLLDFAIIALVLFLLVRAINKLQHPAPAAPAGPTKEELLLTEIRDLLARK